MRYFSVAVAPDLRKKTSISAGLHLRGSSRAKSQRNMWKNARRNNGSDPRADRYQVKQAVRAH